VSARRLARASVAAAATLALVGCSSSGTPTPSPSLSLAPTPTPSDVGPLAPFLSIDEDQPIATTTAKDDSSYSGATFSILRLEARAESTLLVWTATHPRTLAAGSDFDITKVDNFPVLQTKTDRFAVLTYQTPTGQRQCVCSDMRVMRAESNPQGALYPPLPKGTASVVLTSPWFADVTVRVSQP